MLSENDIQVLRDRSLQLTAELNRFIIEDIAQRISESGQFTATADYLAYRAETLGLHWVYIRKEVAKLTRKSEKEIDTLYENASQRAYTEDIRRFKGNYPIWQDNPAIQQMTRAAIKLADKDFANITQTMGMIAPDGKEYPLKKFYAKTMDFVFTGVSTGVIDYNTATRLACQRLTDKGITAIGYESGRSTSLETAVRRNIMGGLGLLVEEITQYDHDLVGCDGWEISAHAMSAPDHEPIQGKQYSDTDWNDIEVDLKRHIGTLNCGHVKFGIIIGVNEPQYTDEQLEKFKTDNDKGIEYNGKHFTLYQATQKQRQFESLERKWKRENIAANSTDNEKYKQFTAAKVKTTHQKYLAFSKAAGLRTQEARLYTSGWGRSEAAKATQDYKKYLNLNRSE